MDTHSIREQLIERLKDKEYRDLFVAEHLYASLALKNRLLRELRKWTQKQLGEKAEMAQAWVSRLEDPNYGKLTISTLLKLASVFDVALEINYVPFSKMLDDILNFSSDSYVVSSFAEEMATIAIGVSGEQSVLLSGNSVEVEQEGNIQAEILQPSSSYQSPDLMAVSVTATITSKKAVVRTATYGSSGIVIGASGGIRTWASVYQGGGTSVGSNYPAAIAPTDDKRQRDTVEPLHLAQEGATYDRAAAV